MFHGEFRWRTNIVHGDVLYCCLKLCPSHFSVWTHRPATLWPGVHPPPGVVVSVQRHANSDQQRQGGSRGLPGLLLRAAIRPLLHVSGSTSDPRIGWEVGPRAPPLCTPSTWNSKQACQVWKRESERSAWRLLGGVCPPAGFHRGAHAVLFFCCFFMWMLTCTWGNKGPPPEECVSVLLCHIWTWRKQRLQTKQTSQTCLSSNQTVL